MKKEKNRIKQQWTVCLTVCQLDSISSYREKHPTMEHFPMVGIEKLVHFKGLIPGEREKGYFFSSTNFSRTGNKTKPAGKQLSARGSINCTNFMKLKLKFTVYEYEISLLPVQCTTYLYVVTATTPTSVKAQRILHPLSSASTKVIKKEYTSQPKHVRILHRLDHTKINW